MTRRLEHRFQGAYFIENEVAQCRALSLKITT